VIGYLEPAEQSASDKRVHRSYQCSLCHELGANYGFAYRLFATNDLVFLNVFADMLRGSDPAVGRRRCVVMPGVGPQLPVRERTENTRFSAAFGVYIGVEKLRDDYEDDGGLLRWLAWKAFSRGGELARATLKSFGYPIDRVRELMREQAALEKDPAPLELEAASRPTRALARILFESRAVGDDLRQRSGDIGDRVGAFLFYMDNLLDLPKDLRSGGYNALARRFAEEATSDEARQAALEGASEQVDALQELSAVLPLDDHGRYVRRTLKAGFRYKLNALQGLDPKQRERATLRSLRAPRPRARVLVQAKLALAFIVLYFLPSSRWASGLVGGVAWAQDGDTGLDPGPRTPAIRCRRMTSPSVTGRGTGASTHCAASTPGARAWWTGAVMPHAVPARTPAATPATRPVATPAMARATAPAMAWTAAVDVGPARPAGRPGQQRGYLAVLAAVWHTGGCEALLPGLRLLPLGR
jgi:hypothetical protein